MRQAARPRGGLTPAGKRGGKGVQWVRPAAAEGECARMMLKILLIAACLGAVLLDAAKKLDLLSRWHMALCALLLPHALFWWQRALPPRRCGPLGGAAGGGRLFRLDAPAPAVFPARDYQTENRRVRVSGRAHGAAGRAAPAFDAGGLLPVGPAGRSRAACRAGSSPPTSRRRFYSSRWSSSAARCGSFSPAAGWGSSSGCCSS